MYSHFKYIDTNLSKDITKGTATKETCLWFTIPVCVQTEEDKTGEVKTVYEYFSFPVTARDNVEEDLISFSTDSPYIYNIAQMGLFNF